MIDQITAASIVAQSKIKAARCGVYFLVKDGEIVYVGQSTNVDGRIAQHRKAKDFDAFTIIDCDPENLDKIEGDYIRKFQPRLNKAGVTLCSSAPFVKRLRSLGLTVERFAQITGWHPVTVYTWGKERSGCGIQEIPKPALLLLDAWERHPELMPPQSAQEAR